MEKKKSLMERLFNIGVGSFFYVKEKAGEAISEMETKGRENKECVREIGKEVKESCHKKGECLKEISGRIFSSLGIATVKDLEEIKKKVNREEGEK